MNTLAGKEVVSLSVISSQLLEWTDERDLIGAKAPFSVTHEVIGIEGLELALEESHQFRKIVCQSLGRMFIPHETPRTESFKSAISSLLQQKLDLVCSRSLEKMLSKLNELGN